MSVDLQNRAQAALEGLREGFQADGADLELERIEGGAALVRLVVTEETCLECIVDTAILEQVVGVALSTACPELSTVKVEDPRG